MMYFAVAVLGCLFGILITALCSAQSYDRGFDDGYEEGYEEGIRACQGWEKIRKDMESDNNG